MFCIVKGKKEPGVLFVRMNVHVWTCGPPFSPPPPVPQRSGHACEDCHSSCVECQGPGLANCTVCPSQAILEAGGRCLLCCHPGEEEEESAAQQQDCCNCTETRGGLNAGPAPLSVRGAELKVEVSSADDITIAKYASPEPK